MVSALHVAKVRAVCQRIDESLHVHVIIIGPGAISCVFSAGAIAWSRAQLRNTAGGVFTRRCPRFTTLRVVRPISKL
jgi:hypothetical protein